MILVIAEQKDGKLNRATWEAIVGAQQLAQVSSDGPSGLSSKVAAPRPFGELGRDDQLPGAAAREPEAQVVVLATSPDLE